MTAVEASGTVTPTVTVQQLDHIVLRVADPEVSLAWYVEKFGFKAHRVDLYREGKVPFPSVEITPGTIIDLDGRKPATGVNLSHYALVVDEIDLKALAASDEFPGADGPYRRWGARGPADLLYVKDPDGHIIELRHYGPSQLTD